MPSASYIKPGQSASRGPPYPPLPTTTPFKPGQWPEPWLWVNSAKVFLLTPQVWRNVVAEQGEKSRYRERLVAIADHREVNGVSVEIDAEPCDEGINRDHEEDADNTMTQEIPLVSTIMKNQREGGSRDGAILSLLDGFAVMRGMAHNQEKGDCCGYEREHAANNLAETVEGNAAIPQDCLFNCGSNLLFSL